jgi:hypothetical protein
VGALVNGGVVAVDSFVGMLNQLIDLVDVKSVDNLGRHAADYFVYTVLSVLPWTAHELGRYDFNALMTRIEEYMNRRNKRETELYRIYVTSSTATAAASSSTTTTSAPGEEGKGEASNGVATSASTSTSDDNAVEPYDACYNLWTIVQSMHKDILKEEWKSPGNQSTISFITFFLCSTHLCHCSMY